MSQTDDRADKVLPVTAEVGGEGGSFADPTLQVATFDEQLPRTGDEGDASSATQTVRRHGQSARSAAPDPNSGMIRYPTEPPAPPSARQGLRVGPADWRAALLGAAGGAAVVLGAQLLRRIRNSTN